MIVYFIKFIFISLEISMRASLLPVMFLALFINTIETRASSKLETPIFEDDVTLPYFNARKDNILLEIKIAPANGSGPNITATTEDEIIEGNIPNTLNAIYTLFPNLREKVGALLKDDFYLMITETLSERGSREKVASFIGAYAREIK